MSTPAAVANRLGQLSARLATARQSDLHRYGRFFAALGARVEGARAVARELDRLLARRFNALDYLRADEHGLSRIVADMLDPRGTHGQGTGFLSELLGLDGLDNAEERSKEPLRRAMQGGAHSRLWLWYRYLEEHRD